MASFVLSRLFLDFILKTPLIWVNCLISVINEFRSVRSWNDLSIIWFVINHQSASFVSNWNLSTECITLKICLNLESIIIYISVIAICHCSKFESRTPIRSIFILFVIAHEHVVSFIDMHKESKVQNEHHPCISWCIKFLYHHLKYIIDLPRRGFHRERCSNYLNTSKAIVHNLSDDSE